MSSSVGSSNDYFTSCSIAHIPARRAGVMHLPTNMLILRWDKEQWGLVVTINLFLNQSTVLCTNQKTVPTSDCTSLFASGTRNPLTASAADFDQSGEKHHLANSDKRMEHLVARRLF